MLTIFLYVAIGTFVGWNFPQPGYAKAFQAFVVKKYNELKDKIAKS